MLLSFVSNTFLVFMKLGQKYKNIFVGFLVQMKTLRFAFEINWPLAFISKLIFWSTLSCWLLSLFSPTTRSMHCSTQKGPSVCALLQRRTNKTKPTAHFVRQKLIGYLRAVESLPVCSSLIALYVCCSD